MTPNYGIRRWSDVAGVGDAGRYGYAQVVAARGLVFVAGQSGVDESRNLVAADTAGQACRAFSNLAAALRAAGSDLDRILSITVYLAAGADAGAFVRVRREVLGPHLPASTLLTGIGLFDPAWLVEIDAIALGDDQDAVVRGPEHATWT